MTTPDFDKGETVSTPEQAEKVQLAIKGIIEGQTPRPYSDRLSVSCSDINTPASIAAHMPPAGIDSYKVDDSAYISFMLDWKTGKPVSDTVVGMVSFTRRDEVARGLIYAGHVNYHVTHKDGVFGLERHVTNTEHGRHMVMKALGRSARYAVEPESQLHEMLELKARIDESRPLEQAMGMLDVSQVEAEAIISFVRSAQ